MRARTHSDFDPSLVALALACALLAGFIPGIVMAGAAAGFWPVGPWWSAVRQVHGHVQLLGWIAAFVLGTGSFFLPRARGAPLAYPGRLPWIAATLGGGLLLRVIAQIAIAVSAPPGNAAFVWRALFALSAALEIAAIVLAVSLFATTFAGGPPLRSRPHLRAVMPLLATAFGSLAVATFLSAGGVLHAARVGDPLVPPMLDRLFVELMIFGFALPVTQAVSAQTFPLFLRLPVPGDDAVRLFAAVYVTSVALLVGGIAAHAPRFEGAGEVGAGTALVAFTLLLDVLTRRRAAWVVAKMPPVESDSRRPTRKGLPDRGEYGRFEWLIYGAYGWETLGAVLLAVNGVADLLRRPPFVSPDAVRHCFTMGFLTLLIAGMAVRMLPGFMRTRLVRPGAVAWIAAAANLAAAARVLPLLVPSVAALMPAFGASGFLAWGAIALLAGILSATWIRSKSPRAPA